MAASRGACRTAGQVPGVWVVLTGWDPEYSGERPVRPGLNGHAHTTNGHANGHVHGLNGHAPAGRVRWIGEQVTNLARLLVLHLGENALGFFVLQFIHDVGGVVRLHLLEDVGCAFRLHVANQRQLQVGTHLLDRVRGGFVVEGLEDLVYMALVKPPSRM